MYANIRQNRTSFNIALRNARNGKNLWMWDRLGFYDQYVTMSKSSNSKVRKSNNNKWFSNELRMLGKIIKYQKVLFENLASVWSSLKFIRNIHMVKIGNEKISS